MSQTLQALYSSIVDIPETEALSIVKNAEIDVSTLHLKDISLFGNLDALPIRQSILSFPEVQNLLSLELTSLDSLELFSWGTRQLIDPFMHESNYLIPSDTKPSTTPKDEIIQILGLDWLDKQLTNISSLILLSKNSSPELCVAATWRWLDKQTKFNEGETQYTCTRLIDLIYGAKAYGKNETEINAKISQFIQLLDTSYNYLDDATWGGRLALSIFDRTDVSKSQIIHYFSLAPIQTKIQRLKDGEEFDDAMSCCASSTFARNTLYENAPKRVIQQAIVKSQGAILQHLSRSQKAQMRAAFMKYTAEAEPYFAIEHGYEDISWDAPLDGGLDLHSTVADLRHDELSELNSVFFKAFQDIDSAYSRLSATTNDSEPDNSQNLNISSKRKQALDCVLKVRHILSRSYLFGNTERQIILKLSHSEPRLFSNFKDVQQIRTLTSVLLHLNDMINWDLRIQNGEQPSAAEKTALDAQLQECVKEINTLAPTLEGNPQLRNIGIILLTIAACLGIATGILAMGAAVVSTSVALTYLAAHCNVVLLGAASCLIGVAGGYTLFQSKPELVSRPMKKLADLYTDENNGFTLRA